MTTTDPETIQRILFLSSSSPVHVYNIPPLTTTKGYKSADWTTPDPRNGNNTRQIFTARLRILETSPVDDDDDDDDDNNNNNNHNATSPSVTKSKVKIDILLEDPSTGELFAAAPYTHPSAVEQVLDSSRFFVVRVVSPDGRKAMLGIGFEERSVAFDFLVGLEEGRKILGFDDGGKEKEKDRGSKGSEKDYSLKPGERIKVDIGEGKGRVVRKEGEKEEDERVEDEKALFSIAPPPPPPPPPASSSSSAGNSGDAFWIPPAPGPAGGSGSGSGNRRRRPPSGVIPPDAVREKEREMEKKKQEEDLGFDDGEFGEFQ